MERGRPTLYTDELGDAICSQVMAGMPLVRICESEDMPHPATVYRWFRLHKEFCDNYARAKEDQADYFVEDILQIADMATPETVQVSRLQVDTRKWAASKYKPKKYGDRVALAGDEKNPIVHKDVTDIKSKLLKAIPEDQLNAIIATAGDING